MSPFGLVLSVPESTALMPFTPLAPAGERLILSQPAPSGAQLTVGGAGSGPFLNRTGSGITCALGRVEAAAAVPSSFAAAALASRAPGAVLVASLADTLAAAARSAAAFTACCLTAAASAGEPTANDAVDGTRVGPVIRSQPLAQPVAAVPTKVGV